MKRLCSILLLLNSLSMTPAFAQFKSELGFGYSGSTNAVLGASIVKLTDGLGFIGSFKMTPSPPSTQDYSAINMSEGFSNTMGDANLGYSYYYYHFDAGISYPLIQQVYGYACVGYTSVHAYANRFDATYILSANGNYTYDVGSTGYPTANCGFILEIPKDSNRFGWYFQLGMDDIMVSPPALAFGVGIYL